MKGKKKEYSDEELRDMAVIDLVRRGKLTIEEIAFTFSLSVEAILGIIKEAGVER